MSETVSIAGLDKAEVLAALYNASQPLGMGYLHYDPVPMTKEQAEAFIGKLGDDHDMMFGGSAQKKVMYRKPLYFDYLKGRVLKVDLSNDEVDPSGYDRDNGDGAFAMIIEMLREKSRC